MNGYLDAVNNPSRRPPSRLPQQSAQQASVNMPTFSQTSPGPPQQPVQSAPNQQRYADVSGGVYAPYGYNPSASLAGYQPEYSGQVYNSNQPSLIMTNNTNLNHNAVPVGFEMRPEWTPSTQSEYPSYHNHPSSISSAPLPQPVPSHHNPDEAFEYINESRYASTVTTPQANGVAPPIQGYPGDIQNAYQGSGALNELSTYGVQGQPQASGSGHIKGYGLEDAQHARDTGNQGMMGYEAEIPGQRFGQPYQVQSDTNGYNRIDPQAFQQSYPVQQQHQQQETNPIFSQAYNAVPSSLSHYQPLLQDLQQQQRHEQQYVASGHVIQDDRGRKTHARMASGDVSVGNWSLHSGHNAERSSSAGVGPINAGFGLPVVEEQFRAMLGPNASVPAANSMHGTDMYSAEEARKKQKKQAGFSGPDYGVEEAKLAKGESGRSPIPPPVKNACLSCRTKKARCDGYQPICGQCSSKGRECVYVKSRRGGARKRREHVLPPAPSALKTFLAQLDGLQAPGGEPPELDGLSVSGEGGAIGTVDPTIAVRSYSPDDVEKILDCYYEEIHPFQPLLPSIKHKNWVISKLIHESPFLIAVRAILSLSPHPKDPNPKSLASRSLRRSQASRLAREASDRVDELLAEVGEMEDKSPGIECVQALSLLGLYEFAQTGNAVKNRTRMNQAVELAMDLGMHQTDKNTFAGNKTKGGLNGSAARPAPAKQVEGKDVFKDMQRRSWWVVFAGMLISGLVAGRRPLVGYDDKRIMSDYPATVVGDDSWGIWIESIGLACQAMDLIMTLDYNLPNPNPPTPPADGDLTDDEMVGMSIEEKKAAKEKKALHKQMIKLDRSVLNLLKQGETMAVIPLVPGGEEEVVRNQQLAASMMLAVCHIQLHRRQAFPEVALFSRKMCGLPKAAVDNTSIPTPQQHISVYGESQSGTQYSPDNNSAYGASSQRVESTSGSFASLPTNVTPIRHSSASSVPPAIMGTDTDCLPLSQEALDAMNSMHFSMDGLLWDSSIYPSSFPMPWFEVPKRAAELYQPLQEVPAWLPPLDGIFTAETGYIGQTVEGFNHSQLPIIDDVFSANPVNPAPSEAASRPQLQEKTSGSASTATTKPHKAWGVDIAQPPVQLSLDNKQSGAAKEEADEDSERGEAVVVGPDGPFPPGMSLARVAQAAHSVIRLEVLHRSATLALWKGPPKWLPFCACGLLSGAYSFLLLSLAVQANSFSGNDDSASSDELEALMTNVKVILAGLEAYGTMWDGIDMMAGEVRAALDAAKSLPNEIRNSASPST